MKKAIYIIPIIILLICLAFAGKDFVSKDIPQMPYPSFLEAVDSNQIEAVTFYGDANYFTVRVQSDEIEKYKVIHPKTDNFTEFLLINNVPVEYKEEGIPRIIQIPIVLSLVGFVFWIIKKNGNGNFKVFDSNKEKPQDDSIQLKDIAGNSEAKLMVNDIIDFLKDPKKYSLVGARMPKGLLFYGPPGTGKTMMAKAVATEAGVPFYAVSGSDFVQMYVGVGASRIRSLFQKAKKQEKAVIFIDEIDAIGKKRGRSVSASNDERDQTLNALLTEMSGFTDKKGIIVIGATNRIDTLDDALLRPGRFDRQIEIALPDINARKKILSLYAKTKPMADDVNLDALSKSTVGYSGAMLENLLNEAAIYAANDNQSIIYQKHVDQAFYTLLVGTPKKDYSYISDRDRKITAFHEAGHALITKLLLPDYYISKITIIPSVSGAGGFNLSIPKDTLYQSKNQIKANIQVLLGGRIAEELTFGKEEITTGASNDIKKASSLMLDYTNKFGMDSDLGLFTTETISDSFDEKLLVICRSNINALYEETKALMKNNIHQLENIAEALLEKESISGEDINKICA